MAAADRPDLRPPGRRYSFGWGSSSYTLTGPALAATDLLPIDAVLLSHDHHGDNLDSASRALLPAAGVVLTTTGARRLGGNARGLQPWATILLEAPGRPTIQVTATPAATAHRSAARRRDVIGFALAWEGQEHGALWITGDPVLYDGVRQVPDRLQVDTALLHLGCVRFGATGPVRYSMDAREAVELVPAGPPPHRHPRPLRGLDPLPPRARCHQTASRAGASRHRPAPPMVPIGASIGIAW